MPSALSAKQDDATEHQTRHARIAFFFSSHGSHPVARIPLEVTYGHNARCPGQFRESERAGPKPGPAAADNPWAVLHNSFTSAYKLTRIAAQQPGGRGAVL